MIKLILKRRNFLIIAISGILCGILISCMQISEGLVNSLSIEGAFFMARDGHIQFESEHYTALLLMPYLNIFIFTAIISNMLMNDYETAKGFVFIRSKSVFKWYKYKLTQSFILCFFGAVIYNITILLMAYIMHFKTDNISEFVYMILMSIGASFLILFFLVNSVLICCFKIKPHFANITVIGISCIVLYSIQMLPMKIAQYNIFTHYFVSLSTLYSKTEILLTYPTWTYYSAILLLIAFEAFIGKIILQKTDMI